MTIVEFHSIPQIKSLTDLKKPKIGYKFLTGNKMIDQVNERQVGQEVTWFEVISVKENGQFEYKPMYSRLTKPTEER